MGDQPETSTRKDKKGNKSKKKIDEWDKAVVGIVHESTKSDKKGRSTSRGHNGDEIDTTKLSTSDSPREISPRISRKGSSENSRTLKQMNDWRMSRTTFSSPLSLSDHSDKEFDKESPNSKKQRNLKV
jgi:hypothetical protein